MEVERREDETVRPSVIFLELAIGGDCCFKYALYRSADSDNLVLLSMGAVDDVTGLLFNMHLLAVHLMLCQVFNVYLAEIAQTTVQSNEGEINALDFHHLHELG